MLSRDSHLWSCNFWFTRYTIYDFLDILVITNLDLTHVSLGLMTALCKEFKTAKEAYTISYNEATLAKMIVAYVLLVPGCMLPVSPMMASNLNRGEKVWIKSFHSYTGPWRWMLKKSTIIMKDMIILSWKLKATTRREYYLACWSLAHMYDGLTRSLPKSISRLGNHNPSRHIIRPVL